MASDRFTASLSNLNPAAARPHSGRSQSANLTSTTGSCCQLQLLPIFWREAAPGVGMGIPKASYFIAKCVVEVPRLALLCLA